MTENNKDRERFLAVLVELRATLERNGETFWANKLSDVIRLVEQRNERGVGLFLSYCGGMGSLTDLVLTQDRAEDDRLHHHREQAYNYEKVLKSQI